MPTPGDVLLFSFIGYKKASITVGSNTKINIQLEIEITEGSEVVIVGYGTQRKSDITGAISSAKVNDLEKLPLGGLDKALQGRIPGMMVQSTNAAPATPSLIRIRGSNSINGGNDPLVVVDGIQGRSLTTLDPNDVATVEVLKDASATAIYGARGANGVILVTTKKGKPGKPTVAYNSYFSLNELRKKIDLMNAAQYASVINDRRAEYGFTPLFSDSAIDAFKTNGGTDWQDEIYRKGNIQNHQLSLSGGSENISYYLSGNLFDQKGILKGSGYNRYSLRSNISSKISSKLSLDLNLALSRETNHPTVMNAFGGQNSGSPIYSALVWAPVKPIYDDQGAYTQPGGGYGANGVYNPVALAVEPVRDYYTNNTNIAGNLEYEISKGFKLSVFGSFQNSDFNGNDYFDSKPTAAPGTEVATIANAKTFSLQNTNMLTYEKKISKHSLKLTGVVEQQYTENGGNTTSAKGFSSDAPDYNNLSLGQVLQIPTSTRSKRALMSYMGRLNYGYDDRYLLTVTARADGSSVFGANNKWGTFPSAAVAWNLLNEKFMSGFKTTFSNLKLRGSYGVTGNQAINPYQSLASLLSNFQYVINGTTISPGVGLGTIANPDLKWEKTAQANAGIDLKLYAGRVEFTADFYNKRTTDLLLSVPLPASAGGSTTILRNVGSVENKGFEVYLGGTPVKNSLTWETGFTVGLNKNKVLQLAENQKEILLGSANGFPGFSQSVWLEVGQPLGLFRGFQYDGVWKSSEATKAAGYGAVPGDSKYIDENGDGKIDNSDIVDIGSAQPKWTFGWNNNFAFRNFDLNVFVNGVQGNKVYNISRVRLETSTSDGDATSVKILNHWTPGNENTDVPSFKGANDGRLNSSRWLEDGSYIRLSNISLGYTLPDSFLGRVKISSARIYISGSNLVTITKYSGYDPEASSDADARAGIDLANYPSQKSYSIGLDIKF